MPFVSQAQRGYFHGIEAGTIKPGPGGPSKKVVREFIAADKPGKLPAHVRPKRAKPKTAAET